jgi:hypothetical protein
VRVTVPERVKDLPNGTHELIIDDREIQQDPGGRVMDVPKRLPERRVAILRDHLVNVTPISRPKSRHEFNHRWIAVAIFIATAIQRNLSVAWPCCLQIVIASVFAELVANRIAPDTHL